MHSSQRRGEAPGRRRLRAGGMLLAAATIAASVAAVPVVLGSAASAATPPVVTIAQTTTGTSLSQGSLGVSFEASDLALPAFASGNLAAYLHTLGSSVMRIGGNTVDETYWTSSGETPPSWSIATITPADLTALDTLAKASGWKVILGRQHEAARRGPRGRRGGARRPPRSAPRCRPSRSATSPTSTRSTRATRRQFFTDFQSYVSAITQGHARHPDRGHRRGHVADRLVRERVRRRAAGPFAP